MFQELAGPTVHQLLADLFPQLYRLLGRERLFRFELLPAIGAENEPRQAELPLLELSPSRHRGQATGLQRLQ